MSQLSELTRPFPPSLVKHKPGQGNAQYVEHGDITQRLLEVLGPFSFTVDEVIRDDAGAPVGVLASLNVTVDDVPVLVREVGESTNPKAPIKSAASDALKRCAMRLGLGLHLWCQDHYYLDRKLNPDDQ